MATFVRLKHDVVRASSGSAGTLQVLEAWTGAGRVHLRTLAVLVSGAGGHAGH